MGVSAWDVVALRFEGGLLAHDGHVVCEADSVRFQPRGLESTFGIAGWRVPYGRITKLTLDLAARSLQIATDERAFALRGREVQTLHASLAFRLAHAGVEHEPVLLSAQVSTKEVGSQTSRLSRSLVRLGVGARAAPESDDATLTLMPSTMRLRRSTGVEEEFRTADVEKLELVGSAAEPSVDVALSGRKGLRIFGAVARTLYTTWTAARQAGVGAHFAYLVPAALRDGASSMAGTLLISSGSILFVASGASVGPVTTAHVPVDQLRAVGVDTTGLGMTLHADTGPVSFDLARVEDLRLVRRAMIETPHRDEPPADANGAPVDLASVASPAPDDALRALVVDPQGGLQRAWLAWSKSRVWLVGAKPELDAAMTDVSVHMHATGELDLEAGGKRFHVEPTGERPATERFVRAFRDQAPPPGEAAPASNRRGVFRASPLPAWRSMTWSRQGTATRHPGTLLDFSPQGCKVATAAAIRGGDVIEVHIDLDGAPLSVKGVVVHAADVPEERRPSFAADAPRHVGVAFDPRRQAAGLELLRTAWLHAQTHRRAAANA